MAESYVVEVLFQKLIAWIEYFTGIINFPSFDESKAFHGKTLFVQSTKSNYISPEDEPEIKRIFPNAEFSWITSKNGSTWFHIESHTEFMQAVITFLEGTKKTTR